MMIIMVKSRRGTRTRGRKRSYMRAAGSVRKYAGKKNILGGAKLSGKAVGRAGIFSATQKVLPDIAPPGFQLPLDLLVAGVVGEATIGGSRHMIQTGVEVGISRVLDVYVTPRLGGIVGSAQGVPAAGGSEY